MRTEHHHKLASWGTEWTSAHTLSSLCSVTTVWEAFSASAGTGLSLLLSGSGLAQNLAHSRRSIKVSYDLLSTYHMLGLGLGFGDEQRKALVLALFGPVQEETTNINHTSK